VRASIAEVSLVSITVRRVLADDVVVLVAIFAEGDRLHAAAQPERFRYAEREVMAWRHCEFAAILAGPEQPASGSHVDPRFLV